MHGSNFFVVWSKRTVSGLNFHAAYDSAHALPIIVTILKIHGQGFI